MGLSENATRQLIFRARAAFKKALLGDDIDTNGMSAAAILSVAARKAAYDAKKVGAQAMVFALFLMVAVGAFIQVGGRGTLEQNLAEFEIPSVTSTVTTGNNNQSAAPSDSSTPIDPTTEPITQPVPVIETVISLPKVSAPTESASPSASPSVSESPFTDEELSQIFDASPEETFVFKVSSNTETGSLRQAYSVASSQGVLADFIFEPDSLVPFSKVKFTFDINGTRMYAYPDVSDFVVAEDKDGNNHYVYYGSLKYVFDDAGLVWDQTKLASATARLELIVNPYSKALFGSVLTVIAD